MKHSTEHRAVKTQSTTRGKSYDRWQVVYHDDHGTRRRKSFSDVAAASAFAKQCDVDSANREQRRAILERRVGERDAGMLDVDALRDATAALAVLEGRATLEAAALAYVRELERREKDVPTVGDAVEQYMEASDGQSLKPRTIKDIRHRLKRLVEMFGPRRVDEITASEIKRALDSLRGANGKRLHPTTRRHFKMQWGAVFNHAIEHGDIAANPVASKTRSRRAAGRAPAVKVPEIFTPEQIRALLLAALDACPEMLAFIALGAFAGIRTGEIMRLDWSKHISLSRAEITLPENLVKTQSRIVPMSGNLVQWLALAPNQTGPVMPLKEHAWRDRRQAVLRVAGIDRWPPNALRHSFGSYYYAMHNDKARTMAIMGHVDRGDVLMTHYRAMVTEQSARDYWAIVPPREKGAITFPKKSCEKFA